MFLLLIACNAEEIFGDPEDTSVPSSNLASTECLQYCNAVWEHCTSLYTNLDECTVACAGWDINGSVDDVTGNTVQCRTNAAIAGDCEGAQSSSATCGEGDTGNGPPTDTGASSQ